MAWGIFILILCTAAAGLNAWRIWRLKKAVGKKKQETIKTLTDRMERDFEEIFRKWEQ